MRRVSPARAGEGWPVLLCLLCCPMPPLAVAADWQPMDQVFPQPRIANGVNTTLWPTVASLQFRQRPLHFCSGVLIGCRTLLSAAHCFCGASVGDDGLRCQPDNNGGFTTPPESVEVFFQNAPPVGVEAVWIQPGYEFGERHDVAVLTLSKAVEGLRPGSINSLETPALGTVGTLVGYGQSDQRVVDYGIKREGEVTLASCDPAGVPQDQHLCWNFPGLDAAGDPGTDSNTCPGDSGGPLFVDLGFGPRVAGVTSGGINVCQSQDTAFDADVYANRNWIRWRTGADLGARTCGQLPMVGEPGTTVFAGSGWLDGVITEARYTFTVDTDIKRLRVALNGDDQMNLDLTVGPRGGMVNCVGRRPGVFEFCEVRDPRAGVWEVVVRNIDGQSGEYQLVSTLFDDRVLFRDGFEKIF